MSDSCANENLIDNDKELLPNIIINSPTNLVGSQTDDTYPQLNNSGACPAPPSSPIDGPVNYTGPLIILIILLCVILSTINLLS